MVRECMKKALDMSKKNKGLFWMIVLVIFAVQILNFSSQPTGNAGEFWLFALNTLLGVISYYWLMNYVLVLTKKKTAAPKDVFSIDTNKFFMMIGVYLLIIIPTFIVGFLTFLCAALLVKYLAVWGMVLSTILVVAVVGYAGYLLLRYQFVLYAYLDQKKINFRKAFDYSWKITEKKIGKIIWFEIKYILLSIVLLIPAMLPIAFLGSSRALLANILFSIIYAVVYVFISHAFGFFFRSIEGTKKK